MSSRAFQLFVLLALLLIGCRESKRPLTVEIDSDDEAKSAASNEEKGGANTAKKGKFTDLGALHDEVSVLRVLHGFDVNDEQMKFIAELAEKTAQDAPARKEFRVDGRYRKALLDLRAALREGDDAKFEDSAKALDAAREFDDPEFDPIELTESARKHASSLFNRLNSRQVVFYLSGLGDGFFDPAERMTEALAESRSLKGKEWQGYRDDVAFQVGQLLGGLDEKEEQKARDRATLILDKAHDLDDAAYRQQKERLVGSVRDLIGKKASLDFVRGHLERVLAEMLSNPQLAAAIAGRREK